MAVMSFMTKVPFYSLLFSCSIRASLSLPDSLPNLSNLPVLHRDVAIIGGGSAGTNVAIRLHDANKTVVVIEAKNRLGGHTETYHDPTTGTTVDYSVVVWHNISQVTSYLSRLNVSLSPGAVGTNPGVQRLVDFRTGQDVVGYIPPTTAEVGAALQRYGEQVAKYPGLNLGYFLPNPVPEDLVLPFGAFVEKYNLGAAVGTIFNFAQGVGDLLSLPTLYAMKLFGAQILQSLQQGFVSTTLQDNSLVYEAATRVLGDNVLLSSTVTSAVRGPGKVVLKVQTSCGPKVIIAKKLIIAVPPQLENLQPWLDLTAQEKELFGKWQNAAYYTGLIRNHGLPANTSFSNIGQDTPYHLPALPGSYAISPTRIPELRDVKFGSPTTLSSDDVQTRIKQEVGRLGGNAAQTEFAVFSAHVPFELRVSPQEITNGFYDKLNQLQGKKNTYWTGAAWMAHDSSLIWRFNDGIVASVLADL